MLAAASSFALESPVKVSASVSKERLSVGDSADVTVEFDIAEGWHINGNEPGLEFLIPTSVAFELPAGVTAAETRYPVPSVRRLQLAGGRELKLYEGKVPVSATLRYEQPGQAGEAVAVVRYQACNAELCLRPQTVRMPLALRLSDLPGATGATSVASLPGRPFTPPARATATPFLVCACAFPESQ
jgi:DsbC/DsbD-like thiol-disulfide interchange protein